MTVIAPGPDWNRLFETAATQEGYFTTSQADEVGYSPQLLAKYLQNGRVVRARRGIYRVVHFPPGEHEDLVTAWDVVRGQFGEQMIELKNHAESLVA